MQRCEGIVGGVGSISLLGEWCIDLHEKCLGSHMHGCNVVVVMSIIEEGD